MKIDWRAITLISIAVIILLLCREGCNQVTIEDMRGEKAAISDSLTRTRNALHQETSSRTAWQSSAKYYKAQVNQVGDSLMKVLMKAVRGNTVSATQAVIKTTRSGGDWVDGAFGFDSKDPCNPVYSKIFVSPWDSVSIAASSKGIRFDYVTYNSFRIEQAIKKNGLFKKPDLTVTMFNENPYTQTLGLQSFHVSYPDRRFGIGPVIGLGWSTSLVPAPIIGIGITYNLLRF